MGQATPVLLILAVPGLAAGIAPAPAPVLPHAGPHLDSVLEQRQAAYEALADRLEAHAEWCGEKRLHLERKKTYDVLLELRPNHEDARRILGYKRDKNGEWVPPRKPKKFTDKDPDALDEVPDRRKALYEPFLTSVWELLERDGLEPATFQLLGDDVLRFDPENERVHQMRGEVRMGGQWVMKETLAAKSGRRKFSELIREIISRVPAPEWTRPDEFEKELGIDWVDVAAMPHFRVLGTGEREETERVALALHAAYDLFREFFGVEGRYGPECRVFILGRPGEGPAFLEKYPLEPNRRAHYMTLDGTGIEGTSDFAYWARDAPHRIDGIVRIAIGWLLADSYGLTFEDAWAYEGFGLYLTRALVRTRLTWFVQPTAVLDAQADHELRLALMNPEANWMSEALKVFRRGARLNVEELAGKDLTELSTETCSWPTSWWPSSWRPGPSTPPSSWPACRRAAPRCGSWRRPWEWTRWSSRRRSKGGSRNAGSRPRQGPNETRSRPSERREPGIVGEAIP